MRSKRVESVRICKLKLSASSLFTHTYNLVQISTSGRENVRETRNRWKVLYSPYMQRML